MALGAQDGIPYEKRKWRTILKEWQRQRPRMQEIYALIASVGCKNWELLHRRGPRYLYRNCSLLMLNVWNVIEDSLTVCAWRVEPYSNPGQRFSTRCQLLLCFLRWRSYANLYRLLLCVMLALFFRCVAPICYVLNTAALVLHLPCLSAFVESILFCGPYFSRNSFRWALFILHWMNTLLLVVKLAYRCPYCCPISLLNTYGTLQTSRWSAIRCCTMPTWRRNGLTKNGGECSSAECRKQNGLTVGRRVTRICIVKNAPSVNFHHCFMGS